jgi:hypothetical protein
MAQLPDVVLHTTYRSFCNPEDGIIYRLNYMMDSRMRGLDTGYHCLYFSFTIASKKSQDAPPSRPARSRSSRVIICACSMRGRRSVALPYSELDRTSSKMSSTMWLARSPIQWTFYAGSLSIGDTKSTRCVEHIRLANRLARIVSQRLTVFVVARA